MNPVVDFIIILMVLLIAIFMFVTQKRIMDGIFDMLCEIKEMQMKNENDHYAIWKIYESIKEKETVA